MTKAYIATLLLVLANSAGPAGVSGPVPVRFPEGVVHGFLVLQSVGGNVIGRGDLLQEARGDSMESRMLLHLDDGSVHDETVRFTQEKVFTVRSYHLVQRGPAFDRDLDVTFDRASGRWRLKTTEHGKGTEETDSGTVDLPADVYNGMVTLIPKNFGKDERRTVHYVAFTPKPRVVELEYSPLDEEKMHPAGLPGSIVRYRIKIELGPVTGLLAKVVGKAPPDMYAWMITGTVPAFGRFEGALYQGGPAWRIETTGARLAGEN